MSLKNMIRIKASEFQGKHLKLSDVWTWQSNLHESEDSLIPVPLTEEALAEADSLLIHAELQTASGISLEGLIVYELGSDEVFAIEVLTDGQRFTFNKHVPEMSIEELDRLALYLNVDRSTLLPIQYSVVPKELPIDDGEFGF